MADKLTPKMKRFCDEYLISLNAKQAAIKAGYSKKTADVIGAENLVKPSIKEYIEARQQKITERTEITQDMIVKELAKIGLADDNEVRKSDKLKALELLGKTIGLFKDGTQVNVGATNLTFIDGIPQEEVEEHFGG
jgi:phage terminase small subunit